jgi:tRNA-splicing ligase RtcB
LKKVINTEKLPIKMWLEDIEENAMNQAKNLANLPFAYKWISIMPDSHSGYGMPIGGVMATNGVIVPNAVGLDISCGMNATKTSLTDIDTNTIKIIMGKIREQIPVGFEHNKENQIWDGFNNAPDIQIVQAELPSAKKQLGTLGGGNHFLEIQKGSDNHIWIMIHSGSRNFGKKVADKYHQIAKFMCEKWYSDIPDKDLSFLPIESIEGKEYFNAMKYCMSFAKANRSLMASKIMNIFLEETNAISVENIDIHHNYAAFENHYGKDVLVHRKGATKASLGLTGIIPGSMGTASYITEGLGNPESFESCSHGAGRRMGRKEAERTLNLEEEQEKMIGIVHGLRDVSNLDEAPGAYKNIDDVMENQKDLVKIKVSLKPLASIKG